MKKLNKKGFTLIELLAVVVILGIIAAIVSTTITRVINKNRQDSLKASIQAIADAAELACVQYGTVDNRIDEFIKGNDVGHSTPQYNSSIGIFDMTLSKGGEFADVAWPSTGSLKLKGAAKYNYSPGNNSATIFYECKSD